MTQTLSIEKHPEGVFSKVLTTTYKSGVISKRYLDIETNIPFDIVWLAPKLMSHTKPVLV